MDKMRLVGPLLARIPPRPLRTRDAGAGLLLAVERAAARWPVQYEAAETVYGFHMAGSTRDLIQRYVYIFGVWEPVISAWIADHLRPGDVVLDVGANIGYDTLLASTCVGVTGRVFAFEPVPPIADALRRNVDRNQRTNVEVVAKVVGADAGTAEIFLGGDDNLGRSSTMHGAGRSTRYEVPRARAADEVDPALWPRVRLVKIDTEGDELAAVQGLRPVLDAMPSGAAVVVEISPDQLAERGADAADLMAFLSALGYDGYTLPNDYDPASYLSPAAASLVPLTDVPIAQVDAVYLKRAG